MRLDVFEALVRDEMEINGRTIGARLMTNYPGGQGVCVWVREDDVANRRTYTIPPDDIAALESVQDVREILLVVLLSQKDPGPGKTLKQMRRGRFYRRLTIWLVAVILAGGAVAALILTVWPPRS